MTYLHLLDRRIGDAWPSLATAADRAAFEAVPYRVRIAAESTYDALRIGASHAPELPAILFLANAEPDEPPLTISHREFFARVTQAANAFHALGIGPGDVVSLLLPLVPQAFSALFGAEAAGIANPVNPLLAAGQIAEILRAARTRVLVALGLSRAPISGPRSEHPRHASRPAGDPRRRRSGRSDAQRAFLRCARRGAAGRPPRQRPHDRGERSAAYFHTGGTTGMPKLVRHSHGNQVYQAWACARAAPQTGRAAAVRPAALSRRRGADARPRTALGRRRAGRASPAAGATRTRCATSGASSNASDPSSSAAS
jgi:fatty-acyl-CoA synthase